MQEWFRSLLRVQVPMIVVVLLRVLVGYELFVQGNERVRMGYLEKGGSGEGEAGHPLEIRLRVWIEEERPISERERGIFLTRRPARMFPWYRFFLENAVLPNVWVFAVLITVAEMVLGAMLVLGLLTRVASFLGILLVVNYLLATWHYGFPYVHLNILVLACFVVFLIAGVGRCLGLDALLHEKFPEIPLF